MKTENQMTPEAARSFDGYSAGNAMVVVASYPCGCKPYEDVFTFNRWKAQGFYVRKGEHGIKLAKVTVTTKEDPDSGELQSYRRLGRSVVFCRHQVESRFETWNDGEGGRSMNLDILAGNIALAGKVQS